MKRLLGVVLAGVLAGGAVAQDAPNASQEAQPRRGSWWAIDGGAFIPSSGEIRDRFGDTLLRIGARPFEAKIRDNWTFTTDITVLSARGKGSKLFALPVTAGVTRAFARKEDDFVPIVTIATGPAYYDYSILRADPVQPVLNRISTKRVGWNAHVETAFIVNQRLAIALRYDWYSKTDGFDFSGLSVGLSYAVARF
ncbi:MAG: hypothetical protein SNJ74_07540 [Fimbriimonadaceae bacterium]